VAQTQSATADGDVLVRTDGGVGRITLNRPKAINALTHDMVRTISTALTAWSGDGQLGSIVVDGAGDRGLCAGGDIRSIYQDLQGDSSATLPFWADEYRRNAQISELATPYVAVMDGLVMGGGVGVSAHGSHRIVTERTKMAMPEVSIGLVPDVGGTYLLARAPGSSGLHAALTGHTLAAADAIHAGLADHFVRSEHVPELLAELESDDPTTVIGKYEEDPGPSDLQCAMESLQQCYEATDVMSVVENLRASTSPDAERALASINRNSPICVSVAFEAVRRAKHHAGLRETLDQDYRVSVRCYDAPDLAEGIRAQVIDKDRNPRWQPADLPSVTDELTAAYFASLDERELGLHDTTA
jgi:enoyl-CoA hydratase